MSARTSRTPVLVAAVLGFTAIDLALILTSHVDEAMALLATLAIMAFLGLIWSD